MMDARILGFAGVAAALTSPDGALQPLKLVTVDVGLVGPDGSIVMRMLLTPMVQLTLVPDETPEAARTRVEQSLNSENDPHRLCIQYVLEAHMARMRGDRAWLDSLGDPPCPYMILLYGDHTVTGHAFPADTPVLRRALGEATIHAAGTLWETAIGPAGLVDYRALAAALDARSGRAEPPAEYLN